MCLGKCLSCVSLRKQFEARQLAGLDPEETNPPEIKDAVVLIPIWQQQQVGGAMIFGCVPVGACMEHVEVKQMSSLEQAVVGGRVIAGQVNANGR